MVDWSIFWNNIFPGSILILLSSSLAYCFIHRYQRKKHNKEIRDDLLNQEHKLLLKYYELTNAFSDLTYLDLIPTNKVENMLDKLDRSLMEESKKIKEIKKIEKESEKIENEIEKTEGGFFQISRTKASLKKQSELIGKYMTLASQFTSDTLLFYNRLIAQLGIREEKLNCFSEFIGETDSFMRRMIIALTEEGFGKHKDGLKAQLDSLGKFFVKIERLILTSKIKYR